MKKRLNKRKGFTVAEALIAMVLLGLAASGMLIPFASGTSLQIEGGRKTLASKLASDLMEEVIQTDFDEIIDTYDEYSEEKGQAKNRWGELFDSDIYDEFSRTVSCQEVYMLQQEGTDAANIIKVTVVVSYDGREMVSLSRLVSR